MIASTIFTVRAQNAYNNVNYFKHKCNVYSTDGDCGKVVHPQPGNSICTAFGTRAISTTAELTLVRSLPDNFTCSKVNEAAPVAVRQATFSLYNDLLDFSDDDEQFSESVLAQVCMLQNVEPNNNISSNIKCGIEPNAISKIDVSSSNIASVRVTMTNTGNGATSVTMATSEGGTSSKVQQNANMSSNRQQV